MECLIEHGSFNLKVASVYVPNGQSIDSEAFKYKLHFFDALYQHLHDLFKKEEITVIGDDYNVAPHMIDVHDSYCLDDQVCFSLKEREKLYALCNL